MKLLVWCFFRWLLSFRIFVRLFGVMIPPGRERERVVCEEIGDKHFCRHFIVSCDGFALFFYCASLTLFGDLI